jgi:hypothetical protein
VITFVLGTGRCGSTLVHDVLTRLPATGFVSNVDDRIGRLGPWTACNGRMWRALPPVAGTKGPFRFAPSEGYRILANQVSPLVCDPMRDLTRVDLTPVLARSICGFFDELAARQGDALVVHKFTGWPRARLLAEAFPEASFIHVVRDGRAVASSWLQMPWWRGHLGPQGWHFGPLPVRYHEEWEASRRSFVLLAGLAWKLLLDAFEEAQAEVTPARWHEVRYEDLLVDPHGAFREMVEFIGLDAPAEMDRIVDRVRFERDGRAGAACSLDDEQLDLLVRSLGKHLERWGYPPGAEPSGVGR